MREATIGGLSALDGARPPKAGGRIASPAKQRKAAGFGSRYRRFRSRFALIVGSAGFSAIMIGIVLNATLMQKGHHPAPLFGAGAATHTAAPAPGPVPAPALAAAPILAAPPAAPFAPPVAPPVAPPTAAGPSPAPRTEARAPRAAHRVRRVDAIARLLGEGQPAAARKPDAARKAASVKGGHGGPVAARSDHQAATAVN